MIDPHGVTSRAGGVTIGGNSAYQHVDPARQHERRSYVRFVAAIVSFVIAFGLIGLGIAQRTVFAEGDRVTSEAVAERDAPITIIDGSALNARDGRQKLEIGNALDDQVFAAYGRTGDLIAWAGDTSYNYVTYDAEAKGLATEYVRGDTNEAIDPVGSDPW